MLVSIIPDTNSDKHLSFSVSFLSIDLDSQVQPCLLHILKLLWSTCAQGAKRKNIRDNMPTYEWYKLGVPAGTRAAAKNFSFSRSIISRLHCSWHCWLSSMLVVPDAARDAEDLKGPTALLAMRVVKLCPWRRVVLVVWLRVVEPAGLACYLMVSGFFELIFRRIYQWLIVDY
jgi:hypothetical protein